MDPFRLEAPPGFEPGMEVLQIVRRYPQLDERGWSHRAEAPNHNGGSTSKSCSTCLPTDRSWP